MFNDLSYKIVGVEGNNYLVILPNSSEEPLSIYFVCDRDKGA